MFWASLCEIIFVKCFILFRVSVSYLSYGSFHFGHPMEIAIADVDTYRGRERDCFWVRPYENDSNKRKTNPITLAKKSSIVVQTAHLVNFLFLSFPFWFVLFLSNRIISQYKDESGRALDNQRMNKCELKEIEMAHK